MNRKIKSYRAITYIVLFYLAAACLLLGPGGVLKKDRLVAGKEARSGSAQVRLDQQVQQVFLAEGTYLRYLDLYVTSEDSAGENYRFYLYDELNEILINQEIAMPETQLPGFLRIPVGIETVPQRAYVWQLQGTDTPMDLAVEHTGDTGLTCFGNYYVLADGQTEMMEAQNVVMRLTYTDAPKTGTMAILYALLAAAAAVCIAAVEYQGQKRQKLRREVKLQRVVCLTAGPALAGSVCYLIYTIYIQNLFGGKIGDKVVYGLGIGLAAVFFAWVIWAPRASRKAEPVRQLCREYGMDWLQSAAFAGVLMGTIHFMNAQYQIWQDIAYREVLAWAVLVLLTMGSAKDLLRKTNMGLLALCGLAGIFWYLYQKSALAAALTAEQLQPRLDLLRSQLMLAVSLLMAAEMLLFKAYRKRFRFGRINALYTVFLAAFLILLAVFRNTRGWPVYLAGYFGAFYLFYLGWEKRGRLLANFCNGVMLNFALATVFALARRPFRAWVYSRYNFVFHTVTITATYLTLVVCALTVRLLFKLKEGKRLTDLWGTLLLYGMSVSFLFLTLSRTGYLAVIVMTAVLVPFVTFFCYRQGIGAFFKNLACMALAAVLCLPVAYTGVRLLPAIYNDPYIYEVEESAAAIHKDDPKDSSAYMSVSYFKYVMENKLFADASAEWQEEQEFLWCMACRSRRGETVFEEPGAVLVASNKEEGLGEDFSNGRFEIFRCYMDHWNLTGHDEMGVPLPDGSISVHAHNTYLQVIHDHGLLTGCVYLLFGAVSAIMMFFYAAKKIKEDAYAALPLSIFIGFAVASLVEWLFHPCNPLGFSTMVIFAPLLCFLPGKKGQGKNERK